MLRKGAATTWPPTPSNLASYIDLNSDPARSATRSATTPARTFTVTLDYSNLPQTEMPSDNYAIVVLSQNGADAGVTDLVGNPLDGNFTGSFPTGRNGLAVGLHPEPGLRGAPGADDHHVQDDPRDQDTGILGDQNTNDQPAAFIGQVLRAVPGHGRRPDQVYIQFSGLHNGDITLAVGGGGRGFTGTFDVQVTTNATAPSP